MYIFAILLLGKAAAAAAAAAATALLAPLITLHVIGRGVQY
jgi:hypothetical protein